MQLVSLIPKSDAPRIRKHTVARYRHDRGHETIRRLINCLTTRTLKMADVGWSELKCSENTFF